MCNGDGMTSRYIYMSLKRKSSTNLAETVKETRITDCLPDDTPDSSPTSSSRCLEFYFCIFVNLFSRGDFAVHVGCNLEISFQLKIVNVYILSTENVELMWVANME